jgi:hypothetical protein
MKRVLTLLCLGIFSFAMIGCHADAGVDSNSSGTSYSKKTTTYGTNGDRTTRTEVHTSNP